MFALTFIIYTAFYGSQNVPKLVYLQDVILMAKLQTKLAWTDILKVYQSIIKSSGQYKLICL